MKKYKNVDLIATLEAIMKTNTYHYQSDFEYDKEIIEKALQSSQPEDKILLWLPRPCGTYCLRERDVFLKDSLEHHMWTYYGEKHRAGILAYALKITDFKDKKIMGDLYELDYTKHYKLVLDKALPADTINLYFDKGTQSWPANKPYKEPFNPKLGKFISAEIQPNDPNALQFLLKEERLKRESMKEGNIKEYLAGLQKKKSKNPSEK